MSRAYFLPVGEADCFVLALDTPEGQRIVLIDGGGLEDRRIDLPAWLRAHDIHTIDLMILTHLHEDHLGSLPEVAAELTVRRAVLPVLPFGITHAQASDPVAGETENRRDDLWEYDRMWTALEAQGTEIDLLFPMEHPLAFSFGDYALTCLAPLCGEVSRVREGIGDLRGVSAAEASARRKAVEPFVNAESAVFLLKKGEEHLILFCADCAANTIDRANAAHPLHPRILKLSHHGRNNTGISYTDEQVRAMAPEVIVVTYAPYKSADQRETWAKIDPRAKLLITGDYADGICLEL
ncbi:MAG: MBL fold metallo-hydrolase [Oscillospiraceae bacterium]|nr:MBL fold metallo-hydrolase [Oscillospiraceae bacterium]